MVEQRPDVQAVEQGQAGADSHLGPAKGVTAVDGSIREDDFASWASHQGRIDHSAVGRTIDATDDAVAIQVVERNDPAREIGAQGIPVLMPLSIAAKAEDDGRDTLSQIYDFVVVDRAVDGHIEFESLRIERLQVYEVLVSLVVDAAQVDQLRRGCTDGWCQAARDE